MAATATALDEYRKRVAGLPDDKVIGSILWFTVHTPRTTVDEMRQWFIELGLDESYLPNPVNPVDAFRNATGEMEIRYSLDDQRDARLTIDEVSHNDQRVLRRIIRQTRDKRHETLDYEEVGEAIFYRAPRRSQSKGEHRVRFTGQWALARSEAERQELQKFMDKAYERYQLYSQFPTANAVRATIRNYVIALNSIAVRPSGGVYFVHKTRQDTVDRLQEFVRRFGNGSLLHTLPLVDTEDQREMLADSLQEEVTKSCQALLTEVAELNAKYGKGKLPPKKYAEANGKYQELQERAREYTDILQIGMGDAGTALETALDAISDLATRIDHAKVSQ